MIRKIGLILFFYILKIRLISKFMTSQPGKQIITINVLPNILQSKEYNKTKIFFINQAENEAGRLVPDLFLFFLKASDNLKVGGLQLSFNIIR